VVERGTTGPTVDYQLDIAYNDYLYESSWLLQSRLGSWYQLVILNSVAGDMCFGYGDLFAALYATVDVSDVLITSSNGVPAQ
jgi:hypothetical protein